MSSQEDIRLFRRDAGAENPFAKPPNSNKTQQKGKGIPGSSWGLPQIEWLGVKWECECDIDKMLHKDSQFQANCVLQRLVEDTLKNPWEEIKAGVSLDQRSIYARLSSLAEKAQTISEYDRSSTSGDPGSQSPPQNDKPLSPFSPPLSSPPRTPSLLSPRSKRQSSLSNSMPQLEQPDEEGTGVQEAVGNNELIQIKGQAQHESGEDNDLPRGYGTRAVSASPQLPPSWDTIEQLNNRRSTLRRPRGPVSYAPEPPSSDASSDPEDQSSSARGPDDYRETSQAPSETHLSEVHNISKAQLEKEHKAETEVRAAATTFLYELSNAFESRCLDADKESWGKWGLKLRQGPGKIDAFDIDDYTVEANADVDLNVTAQDMAKTLQDRQVCLLVECKPAQHSLDRNHVFGQEVSELLAEAMRLRAYHRHDRYEYTVYLMSWHHLDCYFSRMDVTEAYLAQLKHSSGLPNHEPPRIRKSKKLNLRVDGERVKVGEICARMVIDMLAMYNGPKKLGIIQFLTA